METDLLEGYTKFEKERSYIYSSREHTAKNNFMYHFQFCKEALEFLDPMELGHYYAGFDQHEIWKSIFKNDQTHYLEEEDRIHIIDSFQTLDLEDKVFEYELEVKKSNNYLNRSFFMNFNGFQGFLPSNGEYPEKSREATIEDQVMLALLNARGKISYEHFEKQNQKFENLFNITTNLGYYALFGAALFECFNYNFTDFDIYTILGAGLMYKFSSDSDVRLARSRNKIEKLEVPLYTLK